MASLENKPKGSPPDDIEAARLRAEDESEEEGGGQQIQFEEGFTGKVMVGTLFVCLIMLPGAIYLGLVAGQSLGSAAQWVTIVLFSEIARRSFLPLKRQEIYCLFYMAGALASTGFGALPGVSGGPFGGFIAMSYLMQSPAMHNVAPLLPHWIAPPPGSPAYLHRNVLDPAWYLPVFWSPVSVLLFQQVFDRMKWMGLGYLLFRVTSDVERLPFPLAPIAASGATALAEASTKEESWRWRVFSTGTIIGLLFGFFYLAIPIFTGVALGKPLQLLPIPFLDLTPSTERLLPTALVGYNPDLGALMVGFLLPFPIVLGGFLSSIIAQIGINPILYHYGAMHLNALGQNGMFPHYISGSPAIQTKASIDFDFWMSFGIGTQLAIAAIGLVAVGGALLRGRGQEKQARRGSLAQVPEGRGDFPWQAALGAWFLASLGYIFLNHSLVPAFPVGIIIFYALFWTPLNSYISARLIALTGNRRLLPVLEPGRRPVQPLQRPGHLVRPAAAERLRRPGAAVPRDRIDRHQVHQHPEAGVLHAADDSAVQFRVLGLPLEDHRHPLGAVPLRPEVLAAVGHHRWRSGRRSTRRAARTGRSTRSSRRSWASAPPWH